MEKSCLGEREVGKLGVMEKLLNKALWGGQKVMKSDFSLPDGKVVLNESVQEMHVMGKENGEKDRAQGLRR